MTIFYVHREFAVHPIINIQKVLKTVLDTVNRATEVARFFLLSDPNYICYSYGKINHYLNMPPEDMSA